MVIYEAVSSEPEDFMDEVVDEVLEGNLSCRKEAEWTWLSTDPKGDLLAEGRIEPSIGKAVLLG